MQWCVNDLLHSDILNEEKKVALTNISKHKYKPVKLADEVEVKDLANEPLDL